MVTGMGVSLRRQQATKPVDETLRVSWVQFRGHMVMEERTWKRAVKSLIVHDLQPLQCKLGDHLMRAHVVICVLKWSVAVL